MSRRSSTSLGDRLAWRRLLDLLFPPRCVGCRLVGAWLCASCLSRIPPVDPPLCPICGDAVSRAGLCARCRAHPLAIERIRSVYYFENALREAVHRLKYRGQTALAEPLGRAIADYWQRDPAPADVVVPVPLHDGRLRERGHNQASLLARAVADATGLPFDDKALTRRKPTSSQVGLGVEERRRNVADAFHCREDALTGKRVILIDDVCTTGATLDAAATALYDGGAIAVHGLTLARARWKSQAVPHKETG